ncbi:hypothetical protein IFR05_003712 [Cadophora sp. M221]|nr:hypothetical protein IFR05_003712 [Cadophora sp. M221]
MADIYRRSLCTIAASDASDSQSGFLHPRKILPEFLISANASSKDSIKTSYVVPSLGLKGDLWIRKPLQPYKYVMQRFGKFSHLGLNKLQHRGWVLQEMLLSPRTLHYTKEQIFWQCRTHALAEGDTEPAEFNYWPWYEWHNDKTFLSMKSPDWVDIKNRSPDGWVPPEEYYSPHTNWLRMVNDYTTRKITNPSDRIPAISGVAAEFHRVTEDQYLAGIWAGDLARGLLWDDQVVPTSRWRPYLGIAEAITSESSLAEKIFLITYTKTCKTSNEFGSIVKASITINAPCLVRKTKKAGEISKVGSGEGEAEPSKARDVGVQTPPSISMDKFSTSEAINIKDEEITHMLVAHLIDYQANFKLTTIIRNDPKPYYWALILSRERVEPGGTAECYRRVGELRQGALFLRVCYPILG